jgi:hypothetical protein
MPRAAEPERGLDGLAHRAAERHALLELLRHRLGDQLRVELRLLNLLDVDEHFAVRPLLDFRLQLLDFRALAADDDAGPRGVDVDLQLVGRALGLDLRDARVRRTASSESRAAPDPRAAASRSRGRRTTATSTSC